MLITNAAHLIHTSKHLAPELISVLQCPLTHLGEVVAGVGDLVILEPQGLHILDDVFYKLVLLLAGVCVIKSHLQASVHITQEPPAGAAVLLRT